MTQVQRRSGQRRGQTSRVTTCAVSVRVAWIASLPHPDRPCAGSRVIGVSSPPIILASASPRRQDLLKAAGIVFDVMAADVDESPQPGETPEAHVRRLAEEKARAVSAQRDGATVLGADTVVVVDGELLGKPRDSEDAAAMLRKLRGKTHEVVTGVALLSRDRRDVRVARTRVTFGALTDEEIGWYVASGEPMDKAGGYAIQGLASRFVVAIDGSYSNVVGLPVALVYRMLNPDGGDDAQAPRAADDADCADTGQGRRR